MGNRRLRWLLLYTVVLAVAFGFPLGQFTRFAWQSDLYSYVLLVPWVSCFCLWSLRRELVDEPAKDLRWSAVPLGMGMVSLAGLGLAARAGWKPWPEDRFAVLAFSVYMLWLAGCCYSLGLRNLRRLAFPLAFMFFVIPLPSAARIGLESFLQHWSADMAEVLFAGSGMPLLRQGTVFVLPGMRLEVAPECSGIHSTVVLFLTSIVAGYVCLRQPWRRVVLTLAVLPLALLRNGFRVFVIGQLCVNVSPDMINSYIHRKGGPIFFGLSLIPFFLLLLWLWRSERKGLRLAASDAAHPLTARL